MVPLFLVEETEIPEEKILLVTDNFFYSLPRVRITLGHVDPTSNMAVTVSDSLRIPTVSKPLTINLV